MGKEGFTLMVTPELLLKLAPPEDIATIRKSKRQQRKPSPSPSPSSPSSPPSPPPPPLFNDAKHQRNESKPPAMDTMDPSLPPYLSRPPRLPFHGLFDPPTPPPQAAAAFDEAELEPIQKLLRGSENLVEQLRAREVSEKADVKKRAEELHEKQYRTNEPKPPPCAAEERSCLACYRDNPAQPLKCAPVVQAYTECARRARQRFLDHGFDS